MDVHGMHLLHELERREEVIFPKAHIFHHEFRRIPKATKRTWNGTNSNHQYIEW